MIYAIRTRFERSQLVGCMTILEIDSFALEIYVQIPYLLCRRDKYLNSRRRQIVWNSPTTDIFGLQRIYSSRFASNGLMHMDIRIACQCH